MSIVELGAQSCPYCGKRFVNTNPAGALPAHSLLAGRYTIGKCLGLDGEGITYSAIDGKEMRRVTIKEYVPVSICAARAADGRVLPRAGREVLFKTTRMDFADLDRSLVRLGRTEGLVTVLDVVETNDTAYAVREPDEGAPLSRYLASREEPLTQEEALVLLRPVVQMNSSFIAAMLTIVGYSINNTIVIFDRIRENAKRLSPDMPRVDVVNRSVQECLGRTINTTLTTLITIVLLYILGVDSIREFALPIIVGLLSGVYSANMINGYVWAFLEEKRKARKAAPKTKTA